MLRGVLWFVLAVVCLLPAGSVRGDVPGSLLIDMALVDVPAAGGVANSPDTRFYAAGVGSVGYDYRIGTYEVTTAQYVVFLNSAAKDDPYGLYTQEMTHHEEGCQIERSSAADGYRYSVADDYANRPVNYVNLYDAARFCNWLTTGNTEEGVYEFAGGVLTTVLDHQLAAVLYGEVFFIPTEDEWYKAAYHDPAQDTGSGAYWRYPTSRSVHKPSNEIVDPDPGHNATFELHGDLYPDVFTVGSPFWRTPVGTHENSASPYGTYDQGGNVSEWTETPHPSYGYVIRGGSYHDYVDYMRAEYRLPDAATSTGRQRGFRVASILVPEPSSLGLLLLGMTSMLMRRKRAG